MEEAKLQTQFKELSIHLKLERVWEAFDKVRNSLPAPERFLLTRFSELFLITRKKLGRADVSNTSFKVFIDLDGIADGIKHNLEKLADPERSLEGRRDIIEQIDSYSDRFLELLPLIKVPFENVDILDEAQKILDDIKNINGLIHGLFNASKVHHNDLENYKVDGQKLIQLLAGKELNDFYSQRAKKEGWKAFGWTVATWLSAILTILMLLYVFIYQIDSALESTINYSLLSTKILITATLGFIAKWTSKRANRHLTEEAQYHRLAVNMATINSFIATLDEANKNNVISTVAVKIFTDGTGNETPTEFETPGIADVAKTVIAKTEK
jgi:hypothetical protein